jgi:hypothetical protein
MTRTACAIAMGAALLLGACQQGQEQRWIDPQPFPETRAELYRQYGHRTPSAVKATSAGCATTMPRARA